MFCLGSLARIDSLSEAAGKLQDLVFAPVGRPCCARVRMRSVLLKTMFATACALGTNGSEQEAAGPDKAKEGMDEVALQREGAGWATRAKLPDYKHAMQGRRPSSTHVQCRLYSCQMQDHCLLASFGEPPGSLPTVSTEEIRDDEEASDESCLALITSASAEMAVIGALHFQARVGSPPAPPFSTRVLPSVDTPREESTIESEVCLSHALT